MHLTKILILTFFLLVGCKSEDTTSDGKEVHLRIKGEITGATLAEFKEAIESIENNNQKIVINAVQLNSFGGSISAAMQIGKIIRKKRLNTYIAEDARCESACIAILLGGVQRYPFGKVGVHRITYDQDIDDDSRVAQDIEDSLKMTSDYIKSMGISLMLDDAINTTESWRMRYLSETEKRQWNVFGTDRLEEEIYFNKLSRELKISRNELIKFFKLNYDECLNQAKKLKYDVFNCTKTELISFRNLKI
jgi:hypothetical protein